jgi:hypothetical protein
MYSEVTPIKTAKGVQRLVGYIGDAKHPNHADKIVSPLKFWHSAKACTPDAFAVCISLGIIKANAAKAKGRKIENLADHEIIRLPDWANLAVEERDFIETKIMAAYPSSPAASAWHIDSSTGSCDLHVLRANFVPQMPGRSRRQRGNPIRFLRSLCDDIHDELNRRRGARGAAHIETMIEVRRRKLKDRGLRSLAEQLSELTEIDWENLPKIIAELGHAVPRYNPARFTVSVLFYGGRKACRYDVRDLKEEVSKIKLAREFRLSNLDDLPSNLPDIDI